jgi:hypothetical protein
MNPQPNKMNPTPNKSLVIANVHSLAVRQAMQSNLHTFETREALRSALPQAFRARALTQARGGVYGTLSTVTLTRALTQSVLITYIALRDGAQASDLAQVPALYPEIFTVVANFNSMTLELGELDMQDGMELASELINLAATITKALAQASLSEEEFTRVYGNVPTRRAITQDEAYMAALESLTSLHDVITGGFKIVRDGLTIFDLPAFVNLYPEINALVVHAPLALQGWNQLTRKHRRDLAKVAIDVIDSVWDTLAGENARDGKPKPPPNPPTGGNGPQGNGSGMA